MNETMTAPAAAALAAAKQKLQQLGGCALLIGVEAYDGLPAEKQLLAGRNDVLAYWKVCRRLGYRPEHIRVLTSPVLTLDEIVRAEQDLGPELHPERSNDEIRARVERWFAGPAPVVLGDASRDAIMTGVAWLASKLVFTVKLDWEGGKLEHELAGLPGLFTYSGHGAHHLGDLVLCPSDVGPGLERAVPFAELRTLIDAGDDLKAEGTPHPADNLTVVLDCCFAADGEDLKALRVPTLTPRGSEPVPAPKHEIGSRVFCASGRDEQAYQGMLGGHWHGAFTWAFTRALEQWKTAPSGQFRKSTVSHIELLFRARMLLEALSFRQHPVLVDRLGNLPVFQYDADMARETSGEPDASRLGGQIDPSDGFAHYQLLAGTTILAEIVATAPNGDPRWGMSKGREYWKINGARFNSSKHATLVVKKVRSGPWSTASSPPFTNEEASFSCPVDKAWSDHGVSANYHKQSENQSEGHTHGGFVVDVIRENGLWSGTMEFYRDTSDGLLFAEMTNNSTRTLVQATHTPLQRCSICPVDIRQPELSDGRSYVLKAENGQLLVKAYYYNRTPYAYAMKSNAVPHKLVLAHGTGVIKSGRELYVQTTEDTLPHRYLSTNRSGNVWYKQTHSSDDEKWIIQKVGGAQDEIIRIGDPVYLKNVGESDGPYMYTDEGGTYVSNRLEAFSWVVALP